MAGNHFREEINLIGNNKLNSYGTIAHISIELRDKSTMYTFGSSVPTPVYLYVYLYVFVYAYAYHLLLKNDVSKCNFIKFSV